MPDIPGNSSTTASVTVGGSVDGTLETIGDHDWFRLQLTAGQAITIAIDGLTLQDPYLRIYDSAGNLIYENDDGGPGTDSLLTFTATYTGTYYVDVGAWDERYTGDYRVTVNPYVPPAVWTVDQIANQLVSGYWDGATHHFNVTQGGTITVNINNLTAGGQNLAREALALWSDIIGVNFQYVTGLSGGQIFFDDNESGAHADADWTGTITSSARVNVSADWNNGNTNINSYTFQTYIHEIGHALGLGHAGNYNGEASYPNDILYQNDGWPATIMSYFDQTENSYFANQGFTFQYVLTPMMADIAAMSLLYGLSTTTRTGDTVYGFNSTANRAIFNAASFAVASYTVFDSGGTDTLDYSGYSAAQRIDLNPETFSNVGGRVGNVAIARGTVIENAIGGTGNDVLIGNGADNVLTGGSGIDQLTGGAGNDSFRGTAAGLSGDTITDFSSGDRILVTDANLGSFTYSLSGNTLSYSGGSLTLAGFSGQLTASAAAGGGVQLVVGQGGPGPGPGPAPTGDVRNDFNGDSRSDMLWRNVSGLVIDWLATTSGGFANNDGTSATSVPNDWSIVGTGDFNGDGRDDILWRHDGGTVTDWLGTATGGFVNNHGNAGATVPTDWRVVGTGDFNGDGRDDILWRQNGGTISNWLGTATGGFANNHGNAAAFMGTGWHVVGTGDFNGDGRDDIVWRNDNGALTNWLGTASGGFVGNDANAFAQVALDLSVAAIGDYNGDGRDDLLMRNDSGPFNVWHAQANGGFVASASADYVVGNDWRVQSPDIFLV